MKRFIFSCAIAAFVISVAQAQFTPGNLAVLRVGTGSETLANTGNSLFVDQFTTNGAPVNSVTIPNTWPTGLILSGVAASEGGMTRSLDRTVLTLAGYNTNRASTSGSLANTTGAAVARGYATIDAAGNYALQQARSDVFSANNPRCAATDGTNDFWLAGGNGGTLYLNPPSAAPVTIQSSSANTRYVKAVNGNLYFTTQSGTAGLYLLSGLPTAAEAASAVFTVGSGQPAGFDFSPAGTTAYVADQRNTSSGGGIQKWINPGTGWTNVYTLTNGIGTSGAFGVVADFSGVAPIVYATTGEGASGNVVTNRLVRFVDTGSGAPATTLATAAAGTAFRAVDFAPDLRPLITGQPQSQTVTSGSDATFAITAVSTFAISYQWQKNGTNLAATASTLTLSNVTAADAAPYQVIVSNSHGSVTSVVVTLTVNTVAVPPMITLQPQSQTNFAGSSVLFTAAASGTDPLSYQWQFNDADLPGETSTSLALTNLAVVNSGNYRLVVSNAAGSTNSQEAYLLVQPVPPSIATEPVSQTVIAGTTVIFRSVATGTAPLSYQWKHNNVDLTDGGEFSGTTTNTLTITDAQPADAGVYFVMVANAGGSTSSAPASLTVVVGAPPSFIPYTVAGSVYAQNFDSLPNPGLTPVNADNPVTIGTTTYGLDDPFDFAFPMVSTADLGGLALSNTMPGWYGLGVAGSKLGASEGGESTGGIISFGPTNNAAANRALGLLATSSTGGTAFGAKFVNATSNLLSQITLHFTGELWRQQPGAKTLSFGYLIDPTATNKFSTNVTAWLPALDVNFPTNALSAVDGTLPANQVSVGVTNQIINWPSGAALWLVWQMTNSAGNSQGLAIDNLTFSAQAPTPVTLTIRQSGSNVLLSWPASAIGYTLQQNSVLSQPGNWSTVSQSVVVSGGTNTVTVPLANSAQYFRLIQ